MKQQKPHFSLSLIEIKASLENFRKNASSSVPQDPNQLLNWFIENVIKNKSKVPRISLLEQTISLLSTLSTDQKLVDSIFLSELNINQIVLEAQNLVDIAFSLRQHMALKGKNIRIEYNSSLMDIIHNKLSYFCKKENKKFPTLLRVNYVLSFIDFKQLNPKQIYDKISEFELNELREQIRLIYDYLMKPWFQKRTPSQFYYEICDILYWNVILDDNTSQKEHLLINFNDKIQNYLCAHKRSDGVLNYYKLFGYLMDLLAINYRKEDPFKIYCLAPLMNSWQDSMRVEQIQNWLEIKGKNLKPQQIQNIFRNTFHVGSTIFMFNLIEFFSKALRSKKQFNILYHLYLSYIKKQYLDIVLPNATFIKTYFKILEFYVIGFINQDRLEGESQLDKLTQNLSMLLLNKKFTFKKEYETVIMFYKVYEARFSYLSSISKKFVSDLQRIYRYDPELKDIHDKIYQGVFRQTNYAEEENSGFEQLNIKRTDRYRGIINLGNSCYMNSFIQAMFMTKKFRSTILDMRDEQNISSSKTLFYALSNIFGEMSIKTIGTESEVQPQLFKAETPEPFKSSWDQHDVAQFGRMYFESLMNELEDDKIKQRIERIFFNKIQKCLICYVCKNERSNIQHLFDFILHLDKKDDAISVSKSLGEYFKGEDMSGQNQVYCEKCRKKTNALWRPHPVRLAEFLIITIGLFQYSGGGKKIKKPFNFEFNINFSKILPNENIQDESYQLYAFIVHIGNEVERGHYICYARNLQENPTIWYCFDDGYVTEREIQTVSDFHFGESQTPYLLFYSTSRRRKSLQVSPIKMDPKFYRND